MKVMSIIEKTVGSSKKLSTPLESHRKSEECVRFTSIF